MCNGFRVRLRPACTGLFPETGVSHRNRALSKLVVGLYPSLASGMDASTQAPSPRGLPGPQRGHARRARALTGFKVQLKVRRVTSACDATLGACMRSMHDRAHALWPRASSLALLVALQDCLSWPPPCASQAPPMALSYRRPAFCILL